jgi:transcriptional regulator with XRE-family HTH domain
MYKTAREAAGLSQEEAAWRLHIGRRTLSDYENHKTLTPPDTVDSMAEEYGQPKLRNMYCTEVCPLGKEHDRVEDIDFSMAVLGLVDEHDEAGRELKELIKIAKDGKITPDELESYKRIERKMLVLRQKITTLKMRAAS